jgi:hypothetical protein
VRSPDPASAAISAAGAGTEDPLSDHVALDPQVPLAGCGADATVLCEFADEVLVEPATDVLAVGSGIGIAVKVAS